MASPVVEVSGGLLKGKEWEIVNGENVFAFLGIPYGKPPVGELRFKAPLPAEPWDEIRDATEDGNPSIGRDPITQQLTGSEDCLFVNVFTKSLKPEKPKPVLVYIHGGAFIYGSNDSNMYNPDYLLTEDIVLVAINYRLGIFGFLSLEDPSLEVPGNAGMKDQLLALKWVQNNIEFFGGDPKNVTICGESAGSAAAHYLVLSPAAKGLFHRAILQSGSAHNPWAYGSARLLEVLAVSHIKAKDEECALEYINKLSAAELFYIQETFLRHKRSALRIFGPVVEKLNPTAFLTEDPVDIIASGNYNHVPLMIGYCDKESLIFDGEQYRLLVGASKDWKPTVEEQVAIHLGMDKKSDVFKFLVRRLEEFYVKSGMTDGQLLLYCDLLFISGIIASAKLHAASSDGPVYLYRFSIETTLNLYKIICNQPGVRGACHADDLGYLFRPSLPNGSKFILEKGSVEEMAVNRMVKLWTNFVKDSDPTPDGGDIETKWRALEKDIPYFLDINRSLSLLCDPESDRMVVWKEVREFLKSRDVKVSGSDHRAVF